MDNGKRALALGMAAIMLVVCASVLAEGSDDVSGSGTTSTPSWYNKDKGTFEIGTADQLKELANLVNNGEAFSGKIVYLTDDILSTNIGPR